jgi:hypothetical protein
MGAQVGVLIQTKPVFPWFREQEGKKGKLNLLRLKLYDFN